MAVDVRADSPGLESGQKAGAMHIENQQNLAGLAPEDAEFLANFPEEKRKKVVRKIDVSRPEMSPWPATDTARWWQMRLIPMLLFLYLITYLDKTNIGTVIPFE